MDHHLHQKVSGTYVSGTDGSSSFYRNPPVTPEFLHAADSPETPG